MKNSLELLSAHRAFDGEVRFYKHASASLNTEAKFALFLPRRALQDQNARGKGVSCNGKTPYLMALAGLTCDYQTFITKSNAVRFAAQHNLALVCPDTSPRGCDPAPQQDSWWLGEGAGYYLNATKEPWAEHYHMWDYVAEELPELVAKNFHLDDNCKSITGHSMGGMGALNFGLKEPQKWKSVSAFAPSANPTKSDWGKEAAELYFNDPEEGREYDPTLLLQDGKSHPTPILIDQGEEDKFLKDLLPENFLNVADRVGQQVIFRKHKGFDHSYWFVQSFIQTHIDYHALYLCNSNRR